MGKTKLIVAWLLVSSLVSLGLFVRLAYAIAPTVSISELGEFINSNTFRLSYSALADDPSSITAQFYFRKEGGSFVVFGPVISGASGEVEVTGTQVNEQVKYYFRVEINSGAAADETSSSYDVSGPSPVQNYWKERVSLGLYRLHWKNPGDADFSRVFIYRSETPSFTADGAHKIGEAGGAPDAVVSWDNIGLDSAKEYYYALRAVDKANNSASLVADAQASVQAGSVLGATTQSGTEQVVKQLPKEEVLSETSEVTPTPTPTTSTTFKPNEPQNLPGEATDEAREKGQTGLVIALIGTLVLIASGSYYLYTRRNK